MEKSKKEKFQEEGFVIIDVLTEQEVNDFREVMDRLLSLQVKAADTKKHASSFQHLGDEIANFGQEARQYYFHLLIKRGNEPIHHAFHHPVMWMEQHLACRKEYPMSDTWKKA